MNGMIREKNISHKIWVIFFSNFSTVMPMPSTWMVMYATSRFSLLVYFLNQNDWDLLFYHFFSKAFQNNLNPTGARNSM